MQARAHFLRKICEKSENICIHAKKVVPLLPQTKIDYTMKQQIERIKHSTWWQNFLIGVLATAVGVGLTFEVDHIVERHKQEQAKRQTAMMAIYDIDDIIHNFIRYKEKDDAFYKVAMYLFTHQDELETVSMDSLWMAGEYLFFYNAIDELEWADNSTELVFSGSMDAIQNLGDITFCENVQQCYLSRRNMVRGMENRSACKKPLPEDFIFQYRKQLPESELDYAGMMNKKAMAGLIRSAFKQPEVILYMRKYLTRDRIFQDFIDELISLNQENKFQMNVTDEDMNRYITDHVNKTMPAKPKLLVGSWETRKDNQLKTFTLNKDYSAVLTTKMDYRIGIFVEEENVNVSIIAPLTFTIDGQWQLENDSLRFNFDPQTIQILAFDLDFSNLPKAALERAKDSLDSRKQEYKGEIQRQIQSNTLWSWTDKVSLSKSGTIMFLETQYTLPWGQTETEKIQLLRAK